MKKFKHGKIFRINNNSEIPYKMKDSWAIDKILK
jgi:hypothetical protein